MSALRDLNTSYEPKESVVAILPATPKLVAGVNGGRWSIAFTPTSGGAGQGRVTTIGPTATGGFPLPAAGVMLLFTARDFPGTIAGNWYVVGSAGGFNLTILETVELPTERQRGA